jgi:putative ABC transport system permease protein
VDALGLLLRARLRRWRGWVSLCLLAGLLSGLALAAVSAGHRTATAFPQFVAAHGYDALVISAAPMPTLATLPGVASATPMHQFAAGTPTCACARPINPAYFSLSAVAPSDLPRMVKLVAGRMPNQNSPDEVLASFRMQQDIGVGVGTVIRVRLYSAAQQSAYLNGAAVTPEGGTVTLRVVGIEAAEVEFPFAATTSYALYTTAAFSRLWAGRTAGATFSFVRLRGGAAAFPRFQAQARAAGAFAVSDADTAVGSIGTAIWPQVLGWWLLAGLTALAGMVVLAQALARQAETDAEPYGVYSALGATWRQLAGAGLIATLLVAVAGASIGTALAVLLSPLTPVGLARVAELSTGFTFDTVVLGPGAGVAVLVVFALGTWPAVRTARRAARADGAEAARGAPRASRTAMLLAGAGAPPSALIGVRRALERGHGRAAIPARTALLGSVLAVAALSAAVVFGASLGHLTSTPALYGQPYGAWFSPSGSGNAASAAQFSALVTTLERDPDITDIAIGGGGGVMIDGRVISAIAGAGLRGPVPLITSGGRLPRTASEVALGATTLRQLGVHAGSEVRVTAQQPAGGSRTSWYRVTGTAVFAPSDGTGGLGTGAVFTLDGLLTPQCGRLPAGAAQNACRLRTVFGVGGDVLVTAVPGPRGQADLARLARAYPAEANLPYPPTSLVNFGEVNFPLLFGLAVAVFGAATLAHALVVSVGRRRRETGLLKVLGFVRRQTAFAMSWHTTTVAVAGLVVGLPLGIAAGRLGWDLFAGYVGFVAVPVVVAWGLIALAAGTIAVANLIALGPAVAAARIRPAAALRAE